MKHRTASLVFLFLLSVTLTCGISRTDASSGKWRRLSESGITVEYQDGNAELARQLIPEVVRRFGNAKSSPAAAELELLARHKDEICRFMAGLMAMSKPGASMMSVFDQAPAMASITRSASKCRRFKIWEPDELRRELRAGRRQQLITYDAISDRLVIGLDGKDSRRLHVVDTIPVVIDAAAERPPLEQAVEQLDRYADLGSSSATIGTVCHEAAQLAMLHDLKIQGTFRRWFCEGAADYITAECIGKLLGSEVADKYRRMHDIKDYESLRDEIDLLQWRAEEWESDTPGAVMDDRTRNAYHAFATHEVEGIADRYGPEAISDIFGELMDCEIRDEDAILDAIKRATAEDFRTRLARYGTKSADPMKGLAVYDVRIGLGRETGENHWQATDETEIIPMAEDGRLGILVSLWYASADPPVQVRCECITSRKPDGHKITEPVTFGSKRRTGHTWFAFTFEEGCYLPGDATVRVYLNNNLVKEAVLTLVSPGEPESTPSVDIQAASRGIRSDIVP